ncbi:carbon-nitrogen hydrolase family protein [Acuticoccus sp.]|uniref:carbon-nitrogen hydrolase family protein n=1 Tax=Acuticoccus sp. TaxID=1904378 RepID=UPI003B52A646
MAAVQLRSTASPEENRDAVVRLVREAAGRGATYVQTPEVTNFVQRDRAAATKLIVPEREDVTLAALRALAAELSITVHIGSLAVRDGAAWRNRGLMIDPEGEVVARYDKIHMFDVALPSGETFRESATYTAGDGVVLVDVGGAKVGMTICFDLRFPRLYEELAVAGATVLTAPSAFAASTGRDHWHALLRVRAIENGAFMIAAAQEGLHQDGRKTYGHSMIVAPWGDVLAEATDTPSVIVADLDLSLVERMRGQIPVLSARRPFTVRHATRAVDVGDERVPIAYAQEDRGAGPEEAQRPSAAAPGLRRAS